MYVRMHDVSPIRTLALSTIRYTSSTDDATVEEEDEGNDVKVNVRRGGSR